MNKHYITLICLLMVGCLVMLFLHKKPVVGKTEIISVKVMETIGIGQEIIAQEISVPQNDGVESNTTEHEQENATLDEEKMYAKLMDEITRLQQVMKAFGPDIEEVYRREMLRKLRRLEAVWWSLMQPIENEMFDKANAELRIFPYQLVDIRDGEVRFPPPNSNAYWNLRKQLVGLMSQPELTDDGIAKIRQLASEIKDMAKTNTPTSAFQLPE